MLFRLKHTCLVSVLCPSLVTCLLLKSLKRKRLKTHSHVFRIPTEDNPNSRSQFHSRKLSCRLETAVCTVHPCVSCLTCLHFSILFSTGQSTFEGNILLYAPHHTTMTNTTVYCYCNSQLSAPLKFLSKFL